MEDIPAKKSVPITKRRSPILDCRMSSSFSIPPIWMLFQGPPLLDGGFDLRNRQPLGEPGAHRHQDFLESTISSPWTLASYSVSGRGGGPAMFLPVRS